MRKLNIFIVTLLLAVFVSGCSTRGKKSNVTSNDTVKATTNKTIKAKSKTWTFSKGVSSKQTQGQGVSSDISTSVVLKTDALSSWTTSNGQFISSPVKYQKVSLKTWERNMRKNYMKSAQKKIHLMTVTQVNQVLKKLGSDIKISKLSDLVYLKTQTNGLPLMQAFVAKGHHLYAINIQYVDTDQTITIERGQVFTDTSKKKATGQIPLNKINGTWIAATTTTSANDTGKIMIKDGYLYQQRYDSYERSVIQELSSYSLVSLNQNETYASQKVNAANVGYQLTRKSVASGDSLGYLYLFLSENKMIRIGDGETTTYTKTSTLVAADDLPQEDITIFEQMDQKYPGEAASTITVKAGDPLVGMSNSIKYLTDPEAGQIISNKDVTLENGTVTVEN
ncbi:hypothetical protein LB941_04680 [Ligilactobacillus sp. WILCCON 0076]|uniref:Lipoprotein n=1 Tax=Ligilactobacillus ubinensis TaxID=2876789 RepID=A0A9X2FIY0_9LACO|nr:hypothetical protein [Ligilactobacillus ubinensis]MCP0886631.1 hypothetical protein [Ligilactobacillus ubinensis]